MLRELREVRQQFDRPFVVDASAYEAAFAVRATALEEQVEATVRWWRWGRIRRGSVGGT